LKVSSAVHWREKSPLLLSSFLLLLLLLLLLNK
jgi:hypothetical protein